MDSLRYSLIYEYTATYKPLLCLSTSACVLYSTIAPTALLLIPIESYKQLDRQTSKVILNMHFLLHVISNTDHMLAECTLEEK